MALSSPTIDFKALTAELRERFQFTEVQADQVTAFVAARVDEENRKYNATLLTKLLMRLGEANGAVADAKAKMVAASVGCVVGMKILFVNRKICRTPLDVAKALGVKPETFKREIRKSADFLSIKYGEA